MEKAGCLGIMMLRTKVGQNTAPVHCRSGIMASVIFFHFLEKTKNKCSSTFFSGEPTKITFTSDRSLSQVQDMSRQRCISHIPDLQYETNKFLKNLCHSQLTHILLSGKADCLIFALRVKHHFRVAWQLCFPCLSKRDGFI